MDFILPWALSAGVSVAATAPAAATIKQLKKPECRKCHKATHDPNGTSQVGFYVGG